VILFLALSCIGVAVAGISAFVIFWPLSLVHLRDRHPDERAMLGESAFLSPKALRWLLSGRYRDVDVAGLAVDVRRVSSRQPLHRRHQQGIEHRDKADQSPSLVVEGSQKVCP